jgi:hypothetical protein
LKVQVAIRESQISDFTFSVFIPEQAAEKHWNNVILSEAKNLGS